MPLMDFVSRFSVETQDRLRYSRLSLGVGAWFLFKRICRTTPDSDATELARSVSELCRVARISPSPDLTLAAEAEIRRRTQLIGDRPVDWSALIGDWKTDRIEKAVILKRRVSDRERGVLLISFDYQWMRLLSIPKLDELAREYVLVTAPTWSPPHCLHNTLFHASYPDRRMYTLISNSQDVRIFPRLSEKVRVVPLYASSWVNPDLYRPALFRDKDIDIVMLAGFGVYKRHFELFRALRELPRETRVVLLGTPSAGRTAADLFREARLYGVADRFELRESASDEAVSDHLARAKISVILSKQEGSCVAVVESMFAGTPVGVLEDAVIGSKAFINEQTGRLFRRGHVGRQMAEFLARAESFSPREWVLENGVSCHGSTRVLNELLKADALGAGEEWTEDIAVHYWRPDPLLLNAADRVRLKPAYSYIHTRFGITLGKQQNISRTAEN